MRHPLLLACVLGTAALAAIAAAPSGAAYPWLSSYDPAQSIENRIPVPAGYERLTISTGGFGDWLRHLPLKPGTPEVLLYNGQKKANQGAHAAVVDIDVGSQDLQQCADAIIRFRAEFLYSQDRYEDIRFRYTNGDEVDFRHWIDGNRPVFRNNSVVWVKLEAADISYANFRKYLDNIFQYAGSMSLNQELVPVKDPASVNIGDVFIKPGSPGHAVLVVDLACDSRTGQKIFLLAQSFMPAQNVHLLKNPQSTRLSPWFEAEFGSTLVTPEWQFSRSELRRFPGE
jgi:hypothetical protein